MAEINRFKIVEEPNIIDDNFLNIIGNEFKFDHEKGLAEWLKNSVDAYIRLGISDSDQYVIFRFIDGKKEDAIFECIDFVGMTETDIEKAFKRWGDPEASKRGQGIKVFGGHGNGGKFYMRQMFRTSHFFTYRDGKLNVFGFNENKKYGFVEGYKSKKIRASEAFKIAGIEGMTLPKGMKEAIISGKTGFTVIRGVGPAKMKNVIRYDRLIEKMKNHPQARKILERINVWAVHNNFSEYTILRPEEIKPLPKFEEPRIIDVPKTLLATEDGEEFEIEMSNKRYSQGKLILKTTEEAFGRGSRGAELNRIDVIGEIGSIASYQLYEINVTAFPQASFIYGECDCPILEDPDMDSVKNDRSKLVENVRSKALLYWIRDQVNAYANEIAAEERKDQEAQKKKISASYNEFLNKWKDRFMNKVLGDLFTPTGGGATDEDRHHPRKKLEAPENGFAFSVPNAEIVCDKEEKVILKASVPDPVPVGSIIKLSVSSPEIECENNSITVKAEDKKVTEEGETVAVIQIIVKGKQIASKATLQATVGNLEATMELEVIGGTEGGKEKKSKNPQILLSGTDTDPLGIDPSGTVTLTERDPLVYQRYQDVAEGIYWINTQSPLAKAILERYNDNSVRWRDYLFQRYVDIFTKQAIHELQKREPDNFRADRIDTDILDSMTRKVHAAAMNELSDFFFAEDFHPVNETNAER